MFWKILGIVAAAWIALIVIGAVIKMLIPVLVISVLAFGAYALYKAVTSTGHKEDVTRY